MAWWNDYDRPEYGRWATRYDTAYWNQPEGRSFGYGAGATGYGGYGYYGDYPRYGEDYTPRVPPSESPAYGREADRLVRRNAYDAGYTVQPRGGPGMTGGYRGARDVSWRPEDWSGRGGFGWSGNRGGGYSRGYGTDYGGYGTGAYSAGAYGAGGYGGGSYGRYDRGYRW